MPRRQLFIYLSVVVLMSVITTVLVRSTPRSVAAPDPWPPFEIVYASESPASGAGAATVRIVYHGRDSWETELVSSPDVRYQGKRTVFDGTNMTTTTPFLVEPQVVPIACGADPTTVFVPVHWLRPIAKFPDAKLEAASDPSRERWVRSVQGEGLPLSIWEYEVDATSKVPLSFVERSGDRVIERVTVTAFRLLPADVSATPLARPACEPERVQPTAIVNP